MQTELLISDIKKGIKAKIIALPKIALPCPCCGESVLVNGCEDDLYGNGLFPTIYFVCLHCDREFQKEMTIKSIVCDFELSEIEDDDDDNDNDNDDDDA